MSKQHDGLSGVCVAQAMVIDCLLHDGAGPMWEDDSLSDVHIDSVFAACDINQDGKLFIDDYCSFT